MFSFHRYLYFIFYSEIEMNGCDFVKWRGKTQRIRGSIIKKRQVRAAILALFGKQAESREHSTQQRSGRKKRKDKQNLTDRQRQTDSSKSMTKHGPTCDLIGKGFFWPPSSRLFGFSTESFFLFLNQMSTRPVFLLFLPSVLILF
jgi:hypothetical protein